MCKEEVTGAKKEKQINRNRTTVSCANDKTKGLFFHENMTQDFECFLFALMFCQKS